MFPIEKAALRQEIRLYLKKAVATFKEKSALIRDRLMTIDTVRHALQIERLMSFVSMPSEVDTIPLFTDRSMIVPYCEADEIVPVRILSLNELEPSGNMKILEPKPALRQDISRRVLPEQIDVVLVPGLAFDHFGNRLGRGKGYYDRFLHHLSADVLTIGLAFEGMIRDQIPYDANDCPVKMVVTENRIVRNIKN
jgi:5-formyltetrahydrofolate cyclo-ligase